MIQISFAHRDNSVYETIRLAQALALVIEKQSRKLVPVKGSLNMPTIPPREVPMTATQSIFRKLKSIIQQASTSADRTRSRRIATGARRGNRGDNATFPRQPCASVSNPAVARESGKAENRVRELFAEK